MDAKKQRPRKAAQGRKCKVCDKPAKQRGLCHRCYLDFLRDRNDGLVTDEEAVKAGLIEPCRRPGPPRDSPWRRKAREVLKKPRGTEAKR